LDIKIDKTNPDLRYCYEHITETYCETVRVRVGKNKDKEEIYNFELTVPVGGKDGSTISPPKRLKTSCNTLSDENKNKKNDNVRDITMDDKEIFRRTGFKSREELLAMIVIICNGDVNKIRDNTTRTLTWFEEWMLIFEALWGRLFQRWEDLAADYRLTNHNESQVFDSKLKLLMSARAG